MKKNTLNIIRCPSCKGSLTLKPEQKQGDEVMQGILSCDSCGKSFNVIKGVPRMRLNSNEREDLSQRWGYQWKQMLEGKLELDTYCGLTEDQEVKNFFDQFAVAPEELTGKTVLDAGCGCGRLTRALGKIGARVVGVDIASSVDRIYEYCRTEPEVDIVQADVVSLPFPNDTFDYISCKLTLCYVPDPEAAFKNLAKLMKPGGRIFISLPDNENVAITLRIKDMLRITPKLPKWLLFYICWGLAPALWLYRMIFKKSKDTIRTNAFLLFNSWHSKFSRHSKGEVIKWFEGEKLNEITTPDGLSYNVNVRGTKPKNNA
jgi:SAM-dependent methyltransferase